MAVFFRELLSLQVLNRKYKREPLNHKVNDKRQFNSYDLCLKDMVAIFRMSKPNATPAHHPAVEKPKSNY